MDSALNYWPVAERFCMVARKTVLVADDDLNDISLLKRAFLKAGIDVSLNVVRDGAEAIQYLDGDKAFADRDAFPMPMLLLLDLKMPRTNGFEVLEWVRSQNGLRRLPVVVMTNSDEPRDIDRAYDLGANSFLKKPDDFSDLLRMSEKLREYWMETNLCPTCNPGRRQS
jgi:CheY-like chemotaxis protein